MKESVWYSGAMNEIWVRVGKNRVERGEQASIKAPGQSFAVPDYLNLYVWGYNLKAWKNHVKIGWLIKLGDL